MKDLRVLLADLETLKASVGERFSESDEWRMLEHRIAVVYNHCCVVYFTDWKRRARWVTLGVLVGGAVVALAMSLFMRGCG